jgi:hypothetical protein
MVPPSARPFLLGPVETPKSWGGERWLNSTRPEGRAMVAGAAQPTTLAERIAADPGLLGAAPRRLFGDDLPIFTKFIHTAFPPRVHVGFRRAVEREALLGWLVREQTELHGLLAALSLTTRAAFDDFMTRYAAWATAQALVQWRREDEAELATALDSLTRPEARAGLAETIGRLRRNRAQLVDLLHEVDLERESGNLLLTSAGVVHAIFGLSHQTHPLDRSRAALQALFGELDELAARGASDGELDARIEGANLGALRAENRAAPPKNEAWLPATVEGRLMLVEPQQTSDTTYSLADFYTPFVWENDRPRFRKGDAARGLGDADLARYLAGADLSATSLAEVRRVPEPVAAAPGQRNGVRLQRLVDEPTRWPFFTAYRLDLDDGQSWHGDHPPGVFQQLVPLVGEAELGDAAGAVGVTGTHAPAFIPAALAGGYRLSARGGAASILVLSVPGARGGSPSWHS